MIKKKDKTNIFIITTIIMIIVSFILLKNSYVINYGLPEYFRSLFKETKELFPNFLFNLNGGTNALNLTSYGIYNPIILISYLFSSFNMKLYLMVINIICSVGSVYLFYYLLRKNKFDEKVSLVATLSLLVMLPIFNSINILFITLCFIGVDKYFEKNKSLFLTISVLLLFIFNIGNSIVSAICILLYYVYKHLINKKNKLSLLTIIIPIIMCLFIIIPSSNFNITFSISTSMYKLFALIIISLIILFEDKLIENKILSIVLAIILLFDFNGVELFVPLYSYIICISLEKVFKSINIKKIFTYIIFIVIFLIINNSIKSYLFYIDTVILLIMINAIVNKKIKKVYYLFIMYLLFYSFVNFEYKNYLKDDYEKMNLESYVSSETYSIKSFEKYSFPYTEGILSKYVVTSDSTNNNYENHIISSYIKASDINYISPSIQRNYYEFNVLENNSNMIIDVPNMMKDKIIYVSFNLEGKTIKINEIKNKNNEYKIYKKGLNQIEVIFDKGKYSISNFKIYYLDPKYLEDRDIKYVDIRKEVEIETNSYLATNIKYDRNLLVMIDNKKVETIKVNQRNLGFIISPGKHNIKVYYKNNILYYLLLTIPCVIYYLYKKIKKVVI